MRRKRIVNVQQLARAVVLQQSSNFNFLHWQTYPSMPFGLQMDFPTLANLLTNIGIPLAASIIAAGSGHHHPGRGVVLGALAAPCQGN
jgi:hypothetical protein